MEILKLAVPVSSFHDHTIPISHDFYFEFEGDSPNKEKTIDAIRALNTSEDAYKEVIQVLELVKDWGTVGGSCVLNTTFVEHPTLGEQSISWSVVKPIRV